MSISSSIKLNTPSLVYIDYLSYNIMIYSVSLFIFIKNISTKLNNKTLDIFNKLSRYVFGIYLVHGIIIGGLDYVNIINLYDTNINIFTIILNTLITLIISFIIVYIFYKIKDNRIKNI